MINLITTWLHEFSERTSPLEIFSSPTRDRTVLKWTPGNGHSYTVCFVDFSEIEAERTDVCKDSITCIVWGSDGRQWAGSVDKWDGDYTESELRKIFGVQGHRLTALTAILYLSLPGYNKNVGEEKARKLRDDKKTQD